jgi:hypothetical protein
MYTKTVISSVVIFSAAAVPFDILSAPVKTEGYFLYNPRFIVEGTVLDSSTAEAELLLPFYGASDAMYYANLNGRYATDDTGFLSGGLGFRYVSNEIIWGLYSFLDVTQSVNNNNFWVVNPGVELMSANIDFHVNGYIPVNDSKQTTGSIIPAQELGGTSGPVFRAGHKLMTTGYNEVEEIGKGVDLELGYTFSGRLNSRAHVGGYYYNYDYNEDILGIQVGLEVPANDNIALTAGYSYDEVRESTATVGLKITLGGMKKRKPLNVRDRMLDPIPRHLGTLAQGTATPMQTSYVNLGHLAMIANGLWYFDGMPGSGTPFDPSNWENSCTITNPCTSDSFTKNTIDIINRVDPEATMYFSTGTFDTGPEIITLYSGQSMYGTIADFLEPAPEAMRPIFMNKGFILQGNNTLSDLNFDGNNSVSTAVLANGANKLLINNVNIQNYVGDTLSPDAFGIDLMNLSDVSMQNIDISSIKGINGLNGIPGADGANNPGGQAEDGVDGTHATDGGNAFGIRLKNIQEITLGDVTVATIVGGKGGNGGNGGDGGDVSIVGQTLDDSIILSNGGAGGNGGNAGIGGSATGIYMDNVTNATLGDIILQALESGNGGKGGSGGDGGNSNLANNTVPDSLNFDSGLFFGSGIGGVGGDGGKGGGSGSVNGLLLNNTTSAVEGGTLTIKSLTTGMGGNGGIGGNGGTGSVLHNTISAHFFSSEPQLVAVSGQGGERGGNGGEGGNSGSIQGVSLSLSALNVRDMIVMELNQGDAGMGGIAGIGADALAEGNVFDGQDDVDNTTLFVGAGFGGHGGDGGDGGSVLNIAGVTAFASELNVAGDTAISDLQGGNMGAGGAGAAAGQANTINNAGMNIGDYVSSVFEGGNGGDGGSSGGDLQSISGIFSIDSTLVFDGNVMIQNVHSGQSFGVGGNGGQGGNANIERNTESGLGGFYIFSTQAGSGGNGGNGSIGGIVYGLISSDSTVSISNDLTIQKLTAGNSSDGGMGGDGGLANAVNNSESAGGGLIIPGLPESTPIPGGKGGPGGLGGNAGGGLDLPDEVPSGGWVLGLAGGSGVIDILGNVTINQLTAGIGGVGGNGGNAGSVDVINNIQDNGGVLEVGVNVEEPANGGKGGNAGNGGFGGKVIGANFVGIPELGGPITVNIQEGMSISNLTGAAGGLGGDGGNGGNANANMNTGTDGAVDIRAGIGGDGGSAGFGGKGGDAISVFLEGEATLNTNNQLSITGVHTAGNGGNSGNGGVGGSANANSNSQNGADNLSVNGGQGGQGGNSVVKSDASEEYSNGGNVISISVDNDATANISVLSITGTHTAGNGGQGGAGQNGGNANANNNEKTSSGTLTAIAGSGGIGGAGGTGGDGGESNSIIGIVTTGSEFDTSTRIGGDGGDGGHGGSGGTANALNNSMSGGGVFLSKLLVQVD